jgi:hypothetical protein
MSRLLGRHATLDVLLFVEPRSFGRARRALVGHSGRHRIEARLAQVARGRLAWLARLAGEVTIFAGALGARGREGKAVVVTAQPLVHGNALAGVVVGVARGEVRQLLSEGSKRPLEAP